MDNPKERLRMLLQRFVKYAVPAYAFIFLTSCAPPVTDPPLYVTQKALRQEMIHTYRVEIASVKCEIAQLDARARQEKWSPEEKKLKIFGCWNNMPFSSKSLTRK